MLNPAQKTLWSWHFPAHNWSTHFKTSILYSQLQLTWSVSLPRLPISLPPSPESSPLPFWNRVFFREEITHATRCIVIHGRGLRRRGKARLGYWAVGNQPHLLHDIPTWCLFAFIPLWLVVWENRHREDKMHAAPSTAPPLHPYVAFPFTPIIIPITMQAGPLLFTFAVHCGRLCYTLSRAGLQQHRLYSCCTITVSETGRIPFSLQNHL